MLRAHGIPAAAIVWCLALAGAAAPSPLAARRPDTEEDLLARLEREHNPVKKAKLEIRLGRVKLDQAVGAYNQDDVERGDTLVGIFFKHMQSAWDTLRGTERNPMKRPDGFRQLDIALREDARLLEDVQHRVPYDQRGPVSKVAQEVDRLHNQVIQALFPPEEPQGNASHPAALVLGLALVSAAPLAGSPYGRPTPAAYAAQTRKDVLTDDETDKLREEQDPGKRILLYIAFAQDRLDRFINFRAQPPDPNYDTGEYLDRLLGEYISIDDEMKDWIEDQYNRHGDMRAGLRTLIERGTPQLEQLRQIQRSPGPFASDYAHSLRDAIDDLTDALDGATKALADQEKKFGQLKRDEKQEAKDTRIREKEERKQTKEEKKLQKQEERKQKKAPEDADEN